MSKNAALQVQVKGQNPLQSVPPVFSNFLAVSHAGNEVQFEFIFLDLNQIALLVQEKTNKETEEPINVDGRTVVKVVMPAFSFMQLKEHLIKVLATLEEQQKEFLEFAEGKNVASRASSR